MQLFLDTSIFFSAIEILQGLFSLTQVVIELSFIVTFIFCYEFLISMKFVQTSINYILIRLDLWRFYTIEPCLVQLQVNFCWFLEFKILFWIALFKAFKVCSDNLEFLIKVVMSSNTTAASIIIKASLWLFNLQGLEHLHLVIMIFCIFFQLLNR